MSTGMRQTLWNFFIMLAAYTIFITYTNKEGLVNGFWKAMPFPVLAFGLLIFLIYLGDVSSHFL